jgi:hypothetical protein
MIKFQITINSMLHKTSYKRIDSSFICKGGNIVLVFINSSQHQLRICNCILNVTIKHITVEYSQVPYWLPYSQNKVNRYQ